MPILETEILCLYNVFKLNEVHFLRVAMIFDMYSFLNLDFVNKFRINISYTACPYWKRRYSVSNSIGTVCISQSPPDVVLGRGNLFIGNKII